MNTVDFGMNLSEALALYNESGLSSEGQWFSVEYRKADGSLGMKKKVRRYAGQKHLKAEKKDFNSLSKESRDGSKMYLIEDGASMPFTIWICLLVKFNNRVIDHRF